MMKKALVLLLAVVTFAASNVLAKDILCLTSRSVKILGIKFDPTLRKALALETETETLLAGKLQTEKDGNRIDVSANLGRSGNVSISLVETESQNENRLFAGKARVRVFNQSGINTDGEESIACSTKK
jgi:hypothetical protein